MTLVVVAVHDVLMTSMLHVDDVDVAVAANDDSDNQQHYYLIDSFHLAHVIAPDVSVSCGHSVMI